MSAIFLLFYGLHTNFIYILVQLLVEYSKYSNQRRIQRWALIRGNRLFQCGYSQLRRLLEGGAYQREDGKLCDETWHPVVNLMESQCKLRQQHDQNFLMERKPLQKKYQHQKKEIYQKSRTVRVPVWDLSKKVNHLSQVV